MRPAHPTASCMLQKKLEDLTPAVVHFVQAIGFIDDMIR